jgi:hypothetical protein
VHQRTSAQTRRPREFPEATPLKFTGLSGVHRTVSGAPREVVLRNSPASGFHSSRSAIIHRTVRCAPDCPVHLRSNGYFRRQRLPAAHLLRASARRGQARPCWRTGHSTVHVRCATGHQGGPRSQNSNGRFPTALMTWRGHRTVRCAPDCPVRHRTDSLPTATFGGWGYKYPNHPTIHCIQVFQLPTTIQELAFIAKHTKKRSNPLPTPHKALVTRESDL